MKYIWKTILGIFVGFIAIIASSIVLSLLSIAIFSGLLTKDAPLDILMTSTWPLVYALIVIVISIIVGVFVSASLSKRTSLVGAFSVVILYGLFSYWISQSPSNLEKAYPYWYTISSYVILFPSAILGYFVTKKIGVNA